MFECVFRRSRDAGAISAHVLKVCLLMTFALFRASSSAEAADRPNIVHIMVDDMAADALGFVGKYPFLDTPNLDRLAEEGVVFENFLVTTSLCSPSRASILTGVQAHLHGVVDNSGHRDPDTAYATYPQLLQQNGYFTAHIGKWHMAEGDQPRVGYTHWFGFDGQGEYFDPPINRNGETEIHEGYMTDILTDEAVALIEQLAGGSQPFAINLWHKAAHEPFLPAPRHSVPAHEVYPKPDTWDDDMSGKPTGMRRAMLYGAHYKKWQASEGKEVPAGLDPKPFNEAETEWYRSHLSTLLAVDDSVGRVLDALEKVGELDRTMVIFTADNGFFMGEYGLRDKRLAYEPSMKIPMILRYPPAGKGWSTQAMGLSLDFASTFLDYAGIEVLDTMQGKSLRPLLEGRVESLRDDVFYEYFQEPFAPGKPTILALRTSRWKYIHYPYESENMYSDEVYDLRSDPLERENLVGNSESLEIQRWLKETLLSRMEELGYEEPAYKYKPGEANPN